MQDTLRNSKKNNKRLVESCSTPKSVSQPAVSCLSKPSVNPELQYSDWEVLLGAAQLHLRCTCCGIISLCVGGGVRMDWGACLGGTCLVHTSCAADRC